MKLVRLLALLSLVISLAAIAVSLQAIRRDPLGTGISKYDLSSPENTLRSIHNIVVNQDIKAALQLLKFNLRDAPNPDAKLLLSDSVRITVVKSVEVSNSGRPKNNGIVVSFVKFTVSDVDYRTVEYFRKDPSGRFYFEIGFERDHSNMTDEDNALESSIGEFLKTGKI